MESDAVQAACWSNCSFLWLTEDCWVLDAGHTYGQPFRRSVVSAGPARV